MRQTTKEWIYILLLATVTGLYFFVDSMNDTIKSIITIIVFFIVLILKWFVLSVKDEKAHDH